jgi:hypothetical protein
MKWTIMMPCLNEADIIESKLDYCLNIGNVVVVEGSIPQTYDIGTNGFSSDGTTEILKSYSDRIKYIPGGRFKTRKDLQNEGMKYIFKNFTDTEILWVCGVDEFINTDCLKIIENHFSKTQDWLLYWDLINLKDATIAYKDRIRDSVSFPFAPGITLTGGVFQERFYRYRMDLSYSTAHAMADSLNRTLYCHPDYFFHRSAIITETKYKIFHYKYRDGLKRMLKQEMSYLVEDFKEEPNTEETFAKAKILLHRVFYSDEVHIEKEWHPSEVLKSKWFKYEPIDYNWNITLDEVLL